MKTTGVFFTAFLFSTLFVHGLWATNSPEADQAWQVILEQAAGPGSRFRSQDEAVAAARAHLDKQEAALRDFSRRYPQDSRHYSAEIRLATVMAAKARVRHDPALMEAAHRILGGLEDDPSTPAPVKADAGFARLSQEMQDANGRTDDETRAKLLASVRAFDAAYPGDRRTGNLLTELSTLYDDQPTQKKALLEEAAPRVTDAEIKQRIVDDLRRVAYVGQPVEIRLQPWQGGAPVDLAAQAGRVKLVLFWASFSLPSIHELAELKSVSTQFAGQPVDFVTVSLDEDRNALAGMMKTADLRWPTHFDGKGWTGELVRRLGINALPTVWVLDRQNRLVSLNARGTEAATIRQALSQP